MVPKGLTSLVLRPPFWIRKIYPGAIWSMEEDKLLLSFDDGPHPVYTPQILDILDKYSVKAYFFLSGQAAERYPEGVIQIIQQGHRIGLHGYQHLDGWKTPAKVWLQDWEKGKKVLEDICGYSIHIGRPPYGHIPFSLRKSLSRQYTIWMWDLLLGDYDPRVNGEVLKQRIFQWARPGSIIVLHENDKSGVKVCEVLGEVIEGLRTKGLKWVEGV
jgi:peptidoglycan/xylan/chitin deacetylase (PgdA/CDA1 family)